MEAQNDFDEDVINNLKEQYRKMHLGTAASQLQERLYQLGDTVFDSSQSAKRALFWGPLGAVQHGMARKREAEKRAIKEILEERAAKRESAKGHMFCKACGRQLQDVDRFCDICGVPSFHTQNA